MGNANCKVHNNTNKSVFIRTYNSSDHVYYQPNTCYWLEPNETAKVEAAADARGLKVAWGPKCFWADNKSLLTVTKIKLEGYQCGGKGKKHSFDPIIYEYAISEEESDLRFNQCAIMKHPLQKKAAIETGRALALLTPAAPVAVFSYCVGIADHWFFVARFQSDSRKRKRQECDRYFVANWDTPGGGFAVADWPGVCDFGRTYNGACVRFEKDWTHMNETLTAHELYALAYRFPNMQRSYHLVDNHCQHFATKLYKQVST